MPGGVLPPAPVRGPIFVMGAMGSGTTLLRLMLDSHEHIAIPPETGFMRAYKAHRSIPFRWDGARWAARLGWTREELDAELRALYERLFTRYAQQHGKRRWGDKTPLHVWHMTAIARLFPDAVFLCLVRHPGGSIASNMNRFRYSLPGAAYHYQRVNHEIVRQAERLPDRLAVIRYEELLLPPEPVMREVLDWLGEPWSPRVLAHDTVQAGRGGPLVVEGGSRVDDPRDVSRISKWRDTLGELSREALQRRGGRHGELLGYAIEEAAVLRPLNRRGAYLTGGGELAARIPEFEDLDLRSRPVVPRHDRLYRPRAMRLEERPKPGYPRAPTRLRTQLRGVVNPLPRPARRLLRRTSRSARNVFR